MRGQPRAPLGPVGPRHLAFALLLLATIGRAQAGDDKAVIETTFGAAKQALVSHDSAAVIGLISHASLERAEAIRQAAMTGTAPAPGTGPAERLAILGLRRAVPATEIGRHSLPDLIEAALGRNWLAPPVLRTATLQHIDISGDHATGTVIANGKPVPLPASFIREDGTWHVDLVPLLALSDALMRLTASLQHKSDDALVADILNRAGAKAKPAP